MRFHYIIYTSSLIALFPSLVASSSSSSPSLSSSLTSWLSSSFYQAFHFLFAIVLLIFSLLFLWYIVWKLILSQIPFFQEIFGLAKKKKKRSQTVMRIKTPGKRENKQEQYGVNEANASTMHNMPSNANANAPFLPMTSDPSSSSSSSSSSSIASAAMGQRPSINDGRPDIRQRI